MVEVSTKPPQGTKIVYINRVKGTRNAFHYTQNKMTVFPTPLSEHNTDLSSELNANEFATQHGFYLACTAKIKPEYRFVKNPDVNPIQYVPTKGHEEQYVEYAERIYILAIDNKVAKIGGTYTGMKKRHSSYNCGTRKARAAGTCSTTNYHITEEQYSALCEGKSVEWYVFDVPLAEATINVWGDEMTYNAKTFYKYESSLCAKYQELTGHFPLLSANAGIE